MTHDFDRVACRACRCGADFARAGAPSHYPPDLELEAIHLDIALWVDLEGQRAEGTVTSTVQARRAGPRSLTLNAVDLAVARVEDADGVDLSWRYDGTKLHVTWARAFAAGEKRRLAVTYGVERPRTGLFFSKPDETRPAAAWFAATDHETERARHWLPCVDHPSVRPRLDFHLRAADRFTILANGELVAEETHGDGSHTAHWRLDAPCPSYLTCFLIGELTRCDDGEVNGVPIAYFAPQHVLADDLRRSFGRTGEMLAWLEDKLGSPYPYPKYFQFAVPDIGGAMENISLVSWDDRFVLDATLAREWTHLVDVINVHEMAHAWFGDWIVCRDYAHAWLKESWATYLETVWLESARGPDEARYDGYCAARNYFGEADGRYQRPIVTRRFDHSWDMYDMHLYPGGAWRLHMLRCQLGDETFWAAVRDYVATYGGSVVETQDFRRVLEQHSGRSLVQFFEQWLYQAGYPHLEVTFAHDAEKGEGTFRVVQTQVSAGKAADKTGTDLASGGPSGGRDGAAPFRFELELSWTVAGEAQRQTVDVERSEHTFVVALAEAPTQVRIDPDSKVLHKLDFNPGDDLLKRQLRAAPDVVGRILAGQELAKTGRDQLVDAVAEAYLEEGFWGVRVELAQALAKAGTPRATERVVELVRHETDPMVLEPLFRCAGKLRDEGVLAALVERLDGALPYRARAAALESVGKQREVAPVERLLTASEDDSLHGFVQGGALYGLAETRRPEVVDRLLAATRRGAVREPARWAAVLALGRLGASLERRDRERVIERLVDLLNDRSERIQSNAMSALGAMRAADAAGALRAYRERASEHLRAPAERILQQLRVEGEPQGPAVAKQIESLEDRLKALEGLVHRLEAKSDAADKRASAKAKKKGKRTKKAKDPD